MGTQPRILIYDIEVTSPVGDAWKGYDTNIHHWRRDWWMLCFAYKWYGEKKVRVVAQPDFPKAYKKDPESDLEVAKKLHELFTQADIVIAHNGDSFDQKKAQTRMVINKLNPVEPYLQIDTKKVAKKHFNFTSNKLDDLARYLGVPGKYDTGGYGLWLGCEAGEPKAWKKMKQYNKQDVIVLEQVYERMLPWMDNHPNMANISGKPDGCRLCQGTQFQQAGFKYTKTGKYQRWQCKNCWAYNTERTPVKTERPKYV